MCKKQISEDIFEKITIDKMKVKIFNHYPKDKRNRRDIERKLFSIFKKYG